MPCCCPVRQEEGELERLLESLGSWTSSDDHYQTEGGRDGRRGRERDLNGVSES